MPTCECAVLVSKTKDRIKELQDTLTSIKLCRVPKGFDVTYTCYIDDTTEKETQDLCTNAGFALKEAPRLQYDKLTFIINNMETDYVALCASDDLWMKQKLEEQLPSMEDYDMSCSAFISVDFDYPPKLSEGQVGFGTNKLFLTACYNSGWIVSKTCKDIDFKYKAFRYDYGIEQAVIRKIMQEKRILILNNALFVYRVHNHQLVNTMLEKEKEIQWKTFIYEVTAMEPWKGKISIGTFCRQDGTLGVKDYE